MLVHLDTAATYSYASGKELSKRIERIELAFSSLQQRNAKEHRVDLAEASLTAKPPSTLLGDPSENSHLRFGGHWRPLRVGLSEVHFAGHHMGDVSPSASIPTFSRAGLTWIRLRTGQEPSFSEYPALEKLPGPLKHQRSSIPDRAPQVEDEKLPPREALESFLALYYPSLFHKTLPVIDAVLFCHTMDIAYSMGIGVPRRDRAAARACIFSFMSILSICRGILPSLPPIDGEMFETMARKLLPEILLDTTTDAFQAIHMLASTSNAVAANIVKYLTTGSLH